MKDLKIYFTSDVHGYIYPTDYRDATIKPMGLLNIISSFDKDGNTLVIDGGDTIQGSPFMTYLTRTEFDVHPMATVMNTGGYDFITLGNHDFNYGYDYLSKYLKHLDAQCICCNIKDRTGELPILPYAIKTLENGLKVGVIGLVTEYVPVWENPRNLTHFEVCSSIPSIQASYDIVRPQVDVLIGIYHGGFERDLETGAVLSQTKENLAYTICEQFAFDILLTGHQHIPMPGRIIEGTHIVQTPHNATEYIVLTASYDSEGSSLCQVNSHLEQVVSHTTPALYEALMPQENAVQKWLDQPVGFLSQALYPLPHLEMACKGSPLANFINQIQLEVSGADLSCTSFANSIKGFNQEVTIRDIVSTYVYPNTLAVLDVTGSVLKQALEKCASYFDYDADGILCVSDRFLKPKVAHYNYDYFSGIHYTFDIKKPVGERVTMLSKDGKSIEMDDHFKLVMNNYRATGVSGYECYQSCPKIDEILIELPEIIINYFDKHHHVNVDQNHYFDVEY
ncbi:MAG: bifunctional metallophosphatase/5'-nucleotidase [Cellulosilyticaceae bacterium]